MRRAAVAFTGSPGFGSDLDGEGPLEINVCDGCLKARPERVVVVQRVVRHEETRTPWDPHIPGGMP